MKLEDILILGKMGFSAKQVQQMMALEAPPAEPTAQPAQIAAPAQVAPAAQQPAVPDPMAAMAQQIADLTAAVTKMQVPNAGTVGNPPPVTSVDDIILGIVQPAAAPESPDFTKGV